MPRALSLIVGSDELSVNNGDLVADDTARFPGGALELVSDAMAIALGGPLSGLTADRLTAGLRFAQPLSWEVKGIGITVGVEGEGSVTIRTAGELLRFSDSLEADDPAHVQTILVEPGRAYISVEFRAGISVSASGAGAQGPFAIKGSVDVTDRFRIANHLAFDASMPVREALVRAFERFRLPYSDANVQALAEGDFLDHEFYGKLRVGVEAKFGFAGVTFGGRSGGEVKQAFRSQIASVALKAKPTFDLGVGITLDYSHEDMFRMVLGGSGERVRMWLLRADETAFSAGIRANLKVALNARVQIETRLEDWLQRAAERMFAPVENEDLRSRLIEQFVDRLKNRPEELTRFVEETEAQINGTLRKLNRLRISASAGIERISENTALIVLEFDRATGQAAFAAAQEGDLLGAAKLPGVTVGEGSFVRSELRRSTALRLQLFETFRASHIQTYFEKSDVRYAGNGLFQFRFTSGTKTESDWFGHRKAVEMYFEATAGATARGVVSDRDLQLCIKTFERNNTEAAQRTVAMLHLLLSNTPHDGVDDALQAALEAEPELAVHVAITFASSAFARLRATPFRSRTQPADLPHTADQANYTAFVDAVDRVYAGSGFRTEGFPNSVERFKNWAHYNVTVNFQERSSKPPNRRSRGNPAVWPQDPAFPALRADTATRAMIRTYLAAAQSFMNLCEDLPMLAKDLDDVQTREQFEELLNDLRQVVQANAGGQPLFFTKPMVAALFAQTQGVVRQVSAPVPGAVSDTFSVDIRVE